MNPTELQADDLKIKMRITVLKWHSKEQYESIRGPGGMVAEKISVSESTSWQGDVLEVISIDLPYVLVRNLSHYNKIKLVLDVRYLVFKRLSGWFVRKSLGE